MKPRDNQVQATESKDEEYEEAVVEEEAFTKYVEDYVGNSIYHHTEGCGSFNGIPIYGHL